MDLEAGEARRSVTTCLVQFAGPAAAEWKPGRPLRGRRRRCCRKRRRGRARLPRRGRSGGRPGGELGHHARAVRRARTGAAVGTVAPVEAGAHLAAVAGRHRFTLFETFLTDLAGHGRVALTPAEAIARRRRPAWRAARRRAAGPDAAGDQRPRQHRGCGDAVAHAQPGALAGGRAGGGALRRAAIHPRGDPGRPRLPGRRAEPARLPRPRRQLGAVGRPRPAILSRARHAAAGMPGRQLCIQSLTALRRRQRARGGSPSGHRSCFPNRQLAASPSGRKEDSA